MAKRTAVIDIGSNSARLVIFQKTSRHGFHLICQQKSRVRISEGAYQHNGMLQPRAIERAHRALEAFMQTIEEYGASRVVAVATSALRDAPNQKQFLTKVKNEFDLDISVIDGKREAHYGAIAANNLLPITNGITIDIGGGSSDMARIRDNAIVETYSLDLGTVRLKELLFDKGASHKSVHSYITNALKKLPDTFRSHTAVGIGGTARALARGIILTTNYPLDKIHGFSYSLDAQRGYLGRISRSQTNQLNELSIKESRHDTIREGASIFLAILEHIEAKEVITGGVGVREGLYLHHRFKNHDSCYPVGLNPSLISIKDRFDIAGLPHGNKQAIAKNLYAIFCHKLEGKRDYLDTLYKALSLSNIGKMLTIYREHHHAHYITMQELNFGFTHQEMVLIALLLNTKANRRYPKDIYIKYASILPSKKTVKWLAFIYTLTLLLHRNSAKARYVFTYTDSSLKIKSDSPIYLAREDIGAMKRPKKLTIALSQA